MATISKYTSPVYGFEVDGKTVYVRSLAPYALIPGKGRVNLPVFLKDQEELAKKLKSLKGKKGTGAEARNLSNNLIIPNILGTYLDTNSPSSLFELSAKKDGFAPDTVEEAAETVQTLKARVAELEAQLGSNSKTKEESS